MKEFTKRCIASLVAIFVVVSLIVFSKNPFGKLFILSGILLLSSIALQEFIRFTHALKKQLFADLLQIFSAFFLLGSFAVSLGYIPINVLGFIGLIYLFSFLFIHQKTGQGAILECALSSFPFFYIVLPISAFFFLLYSGQFDGRFWTFYAVAVTKASDVGGYLGGKLVGKTPLWKVSPKKTREGAFFGLLSSFFVSLFFAYLSSFLGEEGMRLSFLEAGCLGVVLGLLGQIGDLFESLLKRDAGKKDSNKLPGFGGVLDTIDSLLFTVPFLATFLYR